jgi:Galactose oxidase-like, Early set domain/Bacterial Ig domain
MAFGRRQFNLTLLADGSVLATGGNSTGAGLIDMNGGVYNAERWDPTSGQWTTLAAQTVTRQYHSTALLLPDGRVLSSGGGICGTCDQVGYLAKNAEIFTPPYLFKKDGSGQLAPRPEIAGAPGTVSHGTSFEITTPNAASIRKVALIRLGSQTHSVEMEQRYVPLSFTAGAGALTATVPANVNAAVPGVYMLFIVDSDGVPSVARMVQLAAPAPPPPPPPPPPVNQPPTVSLTSPANGARFTSPAKMTLAATATDADGTVTRVEFFNGTTKVGEDTTAPFSTGWNVGAAGTYTLTARATDNAGATTTSSPVTVTVTKKR